MIAIDIENLDNEAARRVFRVTVREGRSTSEHRVTVADAYFEKLSAPGEQAEGFVRRCFEFLLDRESKESILSSFDVSVIARYFPSFERTIGRASAS